MIYLPFCKPCDRFFSNLRRLKLHKRLVHSLKPVSRQRKQGVDEKFNTRWSVLVSNVSKPPSRLENDGHRALAQIAAAHPRGKLIGATQVTNYKAPNNK